MLKNYLTIALRNLMRHKIYAFINIIGMAIGLATCILIVRYVQDELSFDAWHTKSDRIYRVMRETKSGGTSDFLPNTSGALAKALEQDFPEVEIAARMWPFFVNVRHNNQIFGTQMCVADPSIFKILDFPFVKGSLETAFQNPTSIAVTESMAKQLFGNEDPIGKTITVESKHLGGERTISAVLKDIPQNSTIQFDYVTSTVFTESGKLAWNGWRATEGWRPVHTYFLLKENANIKTLEKKLPALIKQYMGAEIEASNAYHLQPLNRIYLYSGQDYNLDWYGDINRVYQFAAIAIFVLAIACMNFTNLSTARSVKRAREIGMRKVSGATRTQIAVQFLGESILTTFLALLVALLIVQIILPEFNAFFSKQLQLDLFSDPLLGLSLLAVALVVGVLAGLYPALFLSSFDPTETLKGSTHKGTKGQWLRKGLVVVQFSISIILIVGTGVVYQQLHYIQNKRLGFNMDQIVAIPIFLTDQETTAANAAKLAHRYQTIKQAFLAHPNAIEATAYRWWMGWGGGITRTVRPQDHEHTEWRMPILEVDEDYIDVFQIELLQGRNFDPIAFPTDTTHAYIVNEAAVNAFGWKDPIGKTFAWVNLEGKDREGKIVGVVKDFHYSPLREKIGPAALTCRSWQFYNLAIRTKAENMDETIAFFKKTWKQFVPEDQPFEHFLWDQQMEDMYAQERRVQALTQFSASMAILLACMGLFGLASFAAEERRKEIGIRKVLGATEPNIITLLSRDFAILVVIANLIAWPIAHYMMRDWLQQFAYRTNLNLWPFLISGLLALLIASLTVGAHALKAARANPIDALRYE